MAREIPLNKKFEVVRLYFEGWTYDEIAKKTGVAKGSVAAIVEELRKGKLRQFEHVTDLVNGLRDLVAGLRKAGMTPAEATLLFILVKRLAGLGVEPAHLETWVRMCQSVPEDELSRSQILQAAIKLAKLEQEGLSYEEAIEGLSSSSAELKRREENLAALKTEEAQLQARKEELLQANRSLGAEHTRLQGMLNALALKEKGVEDHCEDLGEEIKKRQEEVDRLEANEGELTKKVRKLEGESLALEKEVADKAQTLRGLEEVGFARDDLVKLKARLSDIAERNGKKELATRFFEYLESYDSLLRLEFAREKLAQEVESLTKQKESLNRLAEKTGLTPEGVTEGIVALKALRRRGVLPGAIVCYEKVLTEAHTDSQSFQKVVEEFGEVEQALTARDSELKRVDRELETKGKALEKVKREEAKVKASITGLRNSGVKEIHSMRSSAIAEVKKLCQSLQDGINKWGDMRAEMGRCREELRLARYFITLPLSEEALSSLVDEIGVQVVAQYLMIALACCRKKLNPKLRPPTAIINKYYRISEYTEVELADILSWALLILIEEVGSDKGRV